MDGDKNSNVDGAVQNLFERGKRVARFFLGSFEHKTHAGDLVKFEVSGTVTIIEVPNPNARVVLVEPCFSFAKANPWCAWMCGVAVLCNGSQSCVRSWPLTTTQILERTSELDWSLEADLNAGPVPTGALKFVIGSKHIVKYSQGDFVVRNEQEAKKGRILWDFLAGRKKDQGPSQLQTSSFMPPFACLLKGLGESWLALSCTLVPKADLFTKPEKRRCVEVHFSGRFDVTKVIDANIRLEAPNVWVTEAGGGAGTGVPTHIVADWQNAFTKTAEAHEYLYDFESVDGGSGEDSSGEE